MTPERVVEIVNLNWAGLTKAHLREIILAACAEERAAAKEECAKICDVSAEIAKEKAFACNSERHFNSNACWRAKEIEATHNAHSIRSLP